VDEIARKESNPRENVDATTYSAADGTLYRLFDLKHRERHGNGTEDSGLIQRDQKSWSPICLLLQPCTLLLWRGSISALAFNSASKFLRRRLGGELQQLLRYALASCTALEEATSN
jgi:hypothetical protein